MHAKTKATEVKVAACSARVWTGFRLPSLTQAAFFEKLGSIFCPGTVQIQAPLGLTAYLPSILPADNPEAAPDEIALVFYCDGKTEDTNTYHLAKRSIAARAYSDLHALVFDLGRSLSGFPQKFSNRIEASHRYYLFDEPVDWQHGSSSVTVVVRARGTEAEFLRSATECIEGVQNGIGRDGGIVAAGSDYLVFWEHRTATDSGQAATEPDFGALGDVVYEKDFSPICLPRWLWAPYGGVEVKGGESLNFQFERPEAEYWYLNT